MATTTSDRTESQPETPDQQTLTEERSAGKLGLKRVPILVWWAAGLALVVVVLIVSLAIWGPGMDYPTTVSTNEVSTGSGSTVEVERSVRDVTGTSIDDAVDWVTREAAGLFDGLATGVTHALINIERVLKWLPWPAVVCGLALVSFAVGRWPLLVFTPLALLFVGFMGLWENTVDTIALMLVAVALSVAVGFPLGVVGGRSQRADNIMRPILDGMQTMPSFVYLLPGILFFGLGKPAGIFATIIYAVPPVIRLTNLGIRQVSAETVEAARSFGASPAQLLTKVPGSNGAADHHGRGEPDHHDGAGDGDHCQHGRCGRPRRQRAAGIAEERTRQRGYRGHFYCVPGHHHRQAYPGFGQGPEGGIDQRWLAAGRGCRTSAGDRALTHPHSAQFDMTSRVVL